MNDQPQCVSDGLDARDVLRDLRTMQGIYEKRVLPSTAKMYGDAADVIEQLLAAPPQGSPSPEREALATRLHIYARNCSADRMYDAADDLYAAAKLLRTPSGADMRAATIEECARVAETTPMPSYGTNARFLGRGEAQVKIVKAIRALSADTRPESGEGS